MREAVGMNAQSRLGVVDVGSVRTHLCAVAIVFQGWFQLDLDFCFTQKKQQHSTVG